MSDTVPALIVPIDIVALCVGESDVNGSSEVNFGTKDFAEIRSDFSNLPYVTGDGTRVNEKANISEAVLPQLFQPSSLPLQQGIHLHWALPDALTHGRSGSDGRVGFPEVPNRWLVVRLASSRKDTMKPATSVTAWVVESDRLWDKWTDDNADGAVQNANSAAVPAAPIPMATPNRAYMAMGRVFDYGKWGERAAGLFSSRHTTVGYGTETYAAAYLHSQNVFGLHDTLEDLNLAAFDPANTRVSYMVAGWYSDAGKDPLATLSYPGNATPRQKRDTIAGAYKWTYVGADDDPVPAVTICNGLLYDLTWDPKGTHYITPRKPSPLSLAIGNSTVEALSALVASQTTKSATVDVETILNAFQLDLLAELGEPGGMASLDDTLHRAGFAGARAGQLWTIVRKTPGNAGDPLKPPPPVNVTSQDLFDAATATAIDLPTRVAALLDRLNIAQRDYDRAVDDLDSRRSQLFADWYRYALLRHDMDADNPAGVSWEDAYQFLAAAVQTVTSDLAALDELAKTRDDSKTRMLAALDPKEYSLESTLGPRFWQPREPVMLLTGADLHPPPRYGGDGRFDDGGNLVCRLDSSLVKTIQAGTAVVGAADLPPLASSGKRTFAAELAALWAEAFFLDPNQAWQLAAALRAKGAKDDRRLVADIQKAQDALFALPVPAGNVVFNGTAPSPVGRRQWTTPWLPILLQWRVRYYPDSPVGDSDHAVPAYSSDVLTKNYHLDSEDIDLVPNRATPSEFPIFQTYSGMIVLSRDVEIDLRAQIQDYLRDYPDSSGVLADVAQMLKLSAMAQSLSGFNQALLMRAQTLQLMVSDPLALRQDGYYRANFLNNVLSAAIADRNDLAPVPFGCYNPLRAGYMSVEGLRVIDAFGQFTDVTDLRVVRASGLVPPDDPPGTLIALPPRIAQPSRLLFRWVDADNDLIELNSHPATSPVCGWVLFNHLDNALAIYDADGNALGSLNVNGQMWRRAPGLDVEPRIPNAHLDGFIRGVTAHKNPSGFLDDLLKAIDRTVTNVSPRSYKQDQGVAVLIGRPLALVRATLDLEVQGHPALNESWDAYARAIRAGTTVNRDNAGFADVDVAVRLGNLSRVDDGLIGYFDESTDGDMYQTFYAAASVSTKNDVVPPGPNQLLVAASRRDQPIALTMLVDPRAPVHATTGILPGKQIEIPPEMYSTVLNRMAVTFLTTPVLAPESAFALPLPSEPGYQWSWVAPSTEKPEWVEVTDLPSPNPRVTVTDATQQLSEGWLKLTCRSNSH